MLDDSRPPFYRWFPDGQLNICFNALDRHVDAGRGDQAALIHYDSPGDRHQAHATRTPSCCDGSRRSPARCAGSASAKGDRVVIYMPMVPEAVVAMLACARIGAVHSVVFGGFAPPELAARIDDAPPKVVVSASCGIEPSRVVEYKPLLDRAIARSPATSPSTASSSSASRPRPSGGARRRLGRRRCARRRAAGATA